MGRGGQKPALMKGGGSKSKGSNAFQGLDEPLGLMQVDAKYGIYLLTWVFSRVTGAGAHLLPTLAWATVLRYVVNKGFQALSKCDAFAEPRRIHRKNPPASQLERELDWDGPVILSPLAFVLVDLVTPWLRSDRVGAFDGASLLWLFIGHYAAVEPVYYAFHVWLHEEWAYKRSHGHHHSSVTTEAVSGTSHPLHESVAYLANFSLAFLVPAWCGHFSLPLIPIYFAWFDAMNCAGHCNFECFPLWTQYGVLKYLCYTTSYHSLHHTKYKWNYCLFCPLWDRLFKTCHRTTDALHAAVLSPDREKRRADGIFLAHGHDLSSLVCHTPFVSPYNCSKEHVSGTWFNTLCWPLLYAYCAACEKLLPATVMQRYRYRGTEAATWCLPVPARFYLDTAKRPGIGRQIDEAVDAAEKEGVKYVGLAALNKAEWLNGGGESTRARVEANDMKVKIVHGNALTAAAVLKSVEAHAFRGDETVCVTGATAKIRAGNG